jgi:DNA-binding transcriptional LysR family regulator
MNFKLRQLQGFAGAARHGSFSAAAKELAMTQPAFSQLIRELEIALHVKLFERTTRRIELTEAGRRLLSMIERPLDDLNDAFKFVRDLAAGTRGRLAFASLPSVAFGIATHALARFKARYPAIAVRLIEDQNFTILDRVLHREVDFGIGTLATPNRELVFRELLRDELQAVFPADHAPGTEEARHVA